MRPISLSLPAGAIVTGEILNDYSRAPERLSTDILMVNLPTGIIIHVGWFPRFGPSGRFRVLVFEDDSDNPRLNPIEVRDPFEAANVVRTLAETFDGELGTTEHVTTIGYASETDYEAHAPLGQTACLV